MNGIKAMVRDGRIVTDSPIDFPEGTELLVLRRDDAEDDWDSSPEAISAWVKWYESLEPLVFTEEEIAAWKADQKARKEWEFARADEHAEKLRGLWE